MSVHTPGRHYISEGMFVVEVKSGRRMTDRAAFVEANGLMAAAVKIGATQSASPIILERIDDLNLSAWEVRGMPHMAPAPFIPARAAISKASNSKKGGGA